MYIGIAVGSALKNASVNLEQITGSGNGFFEKINSIFEASNKRLEKEVLEDKVGTIFDKVKESMESSKASVAVTENETDNSLEARVTAAILKDLGDNPDEEQLLQNLKEFCKNELLTSVAEDINAKVAAGVVQKDNSNYVQELKKSWELASTIFLKEGGDDMIKLFGGIGKVAAFMADIEASLNLQERQITDVQEVRAIDPEPASPSIRANEQVHPVPAAMEGLQADVQRLNEKFGK